MNPKQLEQLLKLAQVSQALGLDDNANQDRELRRELLQLELGMREQEMGQRLALSEQELGLSQQDFDLRNRQLEQARELAEMERLARAETEQNRTQMNVQDLLSQLANSNFAANGDMETSLAMIDPEAAARYRERQIDMRAPELRAAMNRIYGGDNVPAGVDAMYQEAEGDPYRRAALNERLPWDELNAALYERNAPMYGRTTTAPPPPMQNSSQLTLPPIQTPANPNWSSSAQAGHNLGSFLERAGYAPIAGFMNRVAAPLAEFLGGFGGTNVEAPRVTTEELMRILDPQSYDHPETLFPVNPQQYQTQYPL